MSTLVASASVSVLNASYEPLGATKLARAIALVNSGVAVVEEEDSRILRFAGGEFKIPKVIRLLKFIKVPFHFKEEYWSRGGVLRRDNHTCGYCGKGAAEGLRMTIDHILAQSLGGTDSWTNTVAACQPCNSKKANKTMEEWGRPLMFEPTTPMRVYYKSGKRPGSKSKSK